MKKLILCSAMTVAWNLSQDDKAAIAQMVYNGLGKVLTPATFHTVDDRESPLTMAEFVRHGLGITVVRAHAWKSRGDDGDVPQDRRPLSDVYVTSRGEVEAAIQHFASKGFTLIGEERPVAPLVGILILEERSEMIFVYPGIRLLATDDGGVKILQG